MSYSTMEEGGEGVVPEQNVSKAAGEEVELDDEDEDEDFDFNPFLQHSPSPEASSSLSSENEEGLDEDANDQFEGEENGTAWLELGSDVEEDEFADEDEDIDEDENVEDNNEEAGDQPEENHQGPTAGLDREDVDTNALDTCSPQGEVPAHECEIGEGIDSNGCDGSGSDESAKKLADRAEEELLGQTMDALPDLKSPRKSIIERQRCQTDDEDVEDAIFKRTRARYSLADLSLDELETFLQESDEDDYFQNVDDEEEYRKFLAAVTGNSEGNDKMAHNKEDEDDDDEDNDADFEIEIEEALESDDETGLGKGRKRKHWETFRRPETRKKSRQRTSFQTKDRLLGLAKTPLRPLLPSTTNSQTRSCYAESKILMSDQSSHDGFHIEKTNLINGFTAHQIGQLHCLIYEHVQLLIQVFSLCILDPSRQQIAQETRKMLIEFVDKRDEVLSWKKTPFPDFCFRRPYVHPSVSENVQLHPMPMLSDPFIKRVLPPETSEAQNTCQNMKSSRPSNIVTASSLGNDVSFQPSYRGITPGNSSENPGTAGGDSVANVMESGWVPMVSGPIWSVLDAAPVGLVKDFLTDVATVVQDYRKRHVEFGEYHSQCEREPLFSLPVDPGLQAQKLARGVASSGTSVVSSSQPQQKKTMAAALVESTKKQTVALVPKDIVKVVQRFNPLFNTAFFPHKPPPTATANRVLFTDAEDELLAMGLMAYNNDWKAIQQRFLPCKSMHQIFVRQKNRSSSRAPENSIKAVRRMKASPLTPEEKACIHEGLRVLKSDWIKVWQYCVPYRDPALLPRQWRIAQGIQKSYKTDDATKERRRLYEARRRRLKKEGGAAVDIEVGQQIENDDAEDNSADDNAEDAEEAYVHEAFLADWKPSTTGFMATPVPAQQVLDGNGNYFTQANLGAQRGASYNQRMGELQAQSVSLSLLQSQSLHQTTGRPSSYFERISQTPYTSQGSSCMTASMRSTQLATFDYARRHVRAQLNFRRYRTRKKNVIQTVKLAPDLPTLNLPPSVRVIPQSMLASHQHASSDRLTFIQNRRSNSQSHAAVMADPQCHLQTSRDGREERIVKSDSSTVATTTVVSTSVAAPDRSPSNEANMHFGSHHYGKEDCLAGQKSPSTQNQEPAPSPDRRKVSQMEEPKSMEGNHVTNDTDIHMHPLLLQNSSEDSFHYQHNNYGTGAQIPFNIFARNAQHADFHPLFTNLQRNGTLKHQVAHIPAPLQKATVPSSFVGDFHPLLQKNPEVHASSSSVTNARLNHSYDSGTSGINSTQVVPRMCIPRSEADPTGTQHLNQLHQGNFTSSSPASVVNEKHVNISYDTRLPVEGGRSKEPKVIQGGDSKRLERKKTAVCRKQARDRGASRKSIFSAERRVRNGTASNMQGCQTILDEEAPYFHEFESVTESGPVIFMEKDNTRSSYEFTTLRQSNKDKEKANAVYLKEDSLPEIVMEQEELSDSEDEIGESVQFECEEMGDSDGESSVFEQQSNMLDKEEHCIEFEEEEIISEGDETEEECRVENTVSNGIAGATKDLLSVSAAAFVSKGQNLVRNRSKKLQCQASADDSVGNRSKPKKQKSNQRVSRSHHETVSFGCRRNKRRAKETQETNGICTNSVSADAQECNLNTVEFPTEESSHRSPAKHLQRGRNVKCFGQNSQRINAVAGSVSNACENQLVSDANGSGLHHSEVGKQEIEARAFDKKDSTFKSTEEADETAFEAAEVLSGIHQCPTDQEKESQAS